MASCLQHTEPERLSSEEGERRRDTTLTSVQRIHMKGNHYVTATISYVAKVTKCTWSDVWQVGGELNCTQKIISKGAYSVKLKQKKDQDIFLFILKMFSLVLKYTK